MCFSGPAHLQKLHGESQLYPAFPCLPVTHSSCVPNQEKPNFTFKSWIAHGSGGAPRLLPEGSIHTKPAEKIPVFLSTEPPPTGDLPHPWVEQSIFRAPAFPAVCPRFVSSVSPPEQFQRAGRCSPEVPVCCCRVCSTTCCPRSRC